MAIIVGAAEIDRQEYTLKLLRTGGQLSIPAGRFAEIQRTVREAAWKQDKGADVRTMLVNALGIDE
jgi:hypothetical protein